MPRKIDQTQSASQLAERADQLRFDYDEDKARALFDDVRSLLIAKLAADPMSFLDQIRAAKEIPAQAPVSYESHVSPTADAQDVLAVRVLLNFRADAINEHLPKGHHYGLAFFLLAGTDTGRVWISKHLGVGQTTIRKVRDDQDAYFNAVGEQAQKLFTLSELLRYRLPESGELSLHLERRTLFGGARPVLLNSQRAKLVEMLLAREAVTLKHIEQATGYAVATKQVSRVIADLKKEGIELLLDKAPPGQVKFARAVRCVPDKQ